MILVHFGILFANVVLVLAVLGLISWAFPNSLPGRVAAILRG